jgi:sec-independent protein translocase protein TatC
MSPRLRRGRSRPPMKSPDDVMTLTEHLAELRVRLIRCALAVMLFAILIVAFYNPVLDFLLRPYFNLCDRKGTEFCGTLTNAAGEPQLFILDPVEGLSTRLRVASYGGLILSLPVIMWQIWRFVVPALHAKEKKYAIPFILSSVLLFLLGGTLAYLTLERALEFLIAWAGEDVGQVFQVSKYIRLVTLMVAAFGVGFEFPVLLVFFQLVGVVSPQQLLGAWRYAVVGIVVVAAVITPSGDPISLLALSGPMLVLYFVAILIGWVAQRRRLKHEAAAELA